MNINKQITDALEMHESLLTAVQAAGGSIDSLKSWKYLQSITASELLLLLSPNLIRFYYNAGKIRS
jgi:hypothetical protein